MPRGLFCVLFWGLVACANSRSYQPLDYDKAGLEVHLRGAPGEPGVGAPDAERLGHGRLDSLRSEAEEARREQPSSQPASE